MKFLRTCHPATRILLWLAFAAAAQGMSSRAVLLVCGFAMLAALRIAPQGLWRLLSRTRWVILAAFLVYGFATPGEPLIGAAGVALTREGVLAGALQSARVASMLAGLALLLAITPAEQFLGGLYALMAPMAPFGIPAERIAVRLWLTLEYARAPRRGPAKGLVASMRQDASPPADAGALALPWVALAGRDYLALALGTLLMVAALA